jgi:hypothetical protein
MDVRPFFFAYQAHGLEHGKAVWPSNFEPFGGPNNESN